MMNNNERMNTLMNAGIDTNKYFNMEIAGVKFSVTLDENGNPVIVKSENESDPIANQIIEDGYVRNTKLHRRFVMAQMFRMLNYKSWDGREAGYNAALKNYEYRYTFEMMLEEVKVLSKLETRDAETFNERRHFFTKDVVIKVCEDYLEELKKYISALPNKNCKGIPYKRFNGRDVFVEDLEKKVYAPIRRNINDMKICNTYRTLYQKLYWFTKSMIKLNYRTKKSAAWIDAYKGEGAFYTLKNLIMFHNCRIRNEYGMFLTREESMQYINSRLDAYQGEGWRMFALMKKVIDDNNFDWKSTLEKIYSSK